MNEDRSLPTPGLITPGVIARELCEPIHRVLHVLATRPAIKPVALAGRIRLYSRATIECVRNELTSIDARRRQKEAPRG